MVKNFQSLFIILSFLLIGWGAPCVWGGERVWTSADGTTLTGAAVLGTAGESAFLRTGEEGRTFLIALERFSAGDREYLVNGKVPALPEVDLRRPPSEAEREDLLRFGIGEGWSTLAAFLRHHLFAAYAGELGPSVEEWYFLYRWIDLFQDRAFHAGLSAGGGSFGREWPEPLRASVMGDGVFSREFFRSIVPEDNMAAVSTIMGRIYRGSPEDFEAYKSLALAIAIVYDRPPPSWYPVGGQVPGEIFPSGLPDPVDAFEFFVSGHRAGRLLINPQRLSASELRFAVDIIAPFEELHWAQQRVRLSSGRFPNAYSMIQYDYERNSSGLREVQLNWPHSDYRLDTIRRLGGICVDQAYFASQVGKARGLPTVYFSGGGENGSHAWVGYLQGPGRGWNHDVGRYESGNYVIGRAIDPQTWQPITDHEIAFSDERFLRGDAYRASRLHSDMAREFRIAGRPADALQAARRGIEIEARNRDAWELVVGINREGGRPAAYEGALRMAAGAFRHYPHYEAAFLGQLVESLVRRDELDEAFAVIQDISRKNRRDRPDISLVHSKRLLEIARESGDGDQLVRAYRRVLSDLGGHTPGGIFFSEVARPFLSHLNENGERTQARTLFNRTRQQFRPNPGSLLDRRMNSFEETLR